MRTAIRSIITVYESTEDNAASGKQTINNLKSLAPSPSAVKNTAG